MSAWLEAFEALPDDVRERVEKWLYLQKFIAQTLRIPWRKWVEHYLAAAMERPFDYSFMQATFPAFLGFDGTEGKGVSFTTGQDAATALVARVPLRAKNNLGRLSPDLQDAIAAMLEEEGDAVRLLPSDVAQLQKIFPKEKPLARLDKKSFRKVELDREGDEIVLRVEGGAELFRINVLEISAVMSKALI
jgi:hypothetical protein